MKRITIGVATGLLAIFAVGTAAAGHGAGGAMGSPMGSSMGPTMGRSAPSTMTSQTSMGTPKAIGQPNQSCGSSTAPNTPGNAASAPGSAFNPNGTAGSQYAGQQPQNSVNSATNSQYDVACANQPH